MEGGEWGYRSVQRTLGIRTRLVFPATLRRPEFTLDRCACDFTPARERHHVLLPLPRPLPSPPPPPPTNMPPPFSRREASPALPATVAPPSQPTGPPNPPSPPRGRKRKPARRPAERGCHRKCELGDRARGGGGRRRGHVRRHPGRPGNRTRARARADRGTGGRGGNPRGRAHGGQTCGDFCTFLFIIFWVGGPRATLGAGWCLRGKVSAWGRWVRRDVIW